MLSPKLRLRAEFICTRIAIGREVKLDDMVWIQKLAAVNQTVAVWLRKAQRRAFNPDMQDGDLDSFLNDLDIGGIGNDARGVRGFNSPDEIAEYFRRQRRDDWRQRD